MKTKITVNNHIFQWNGFFYETKEIDPVKRVFLDLRHRQTLIQLKKHFIDM